jgi:hypothetical protein
VIQEAILHGKSIQWWCEPAAHQVKILYHSTLDAEARQSA